MSTSQRPEGPVIPAAWWRAAWLTVAISVLAVAGYLIFDHYLGVAATILILSAILTYLLEPMVERLARLSRMRNKHAARGLAVLVIYLALGTGLYFFGAAVSKVLRENVQDLYNTGAAVVLVLRDPTPASLDTTADALQVARFKSWYYGAVSEDVRVQVRNAVENRLNEMRGGAWSDAALSLVGLARRAGAWLGQLVEFIFVPLVAFYLLTDGARVWHQVCFFIPRRRRLAVTRYALGLNQIMRQYVYSQFILVVIAWLVVTIALVAMRIPGALLLGLIAGLARAIPMVGPIVGGIPVLAAILLSDQWAWAWVWVLIGFTALHLFESKYLMPRILGDTLDIHPVLIIVSLLVGYEVMHLAGMFLAPPIFAMIRYVIAVRREEREAKLPVIATGEGDSVSLSC